MAMTNCRECGAQISDTATSCPYCGRSTRYAYYEKERQKLAFEGILELISLAIGVVLWLSYRKEAKYILDSGFSDWYMEYGDGKKIVAMFAIGVGFTIGGIVALVFLYIRAKKLEVLQASASTSHLHPSSPVKAYSPNGSSWRCTCGRINSNYVSSCICGNSKSAVQASNAQATVSSAGNQAQNSFIFCSQCGTRCASNAKFCQSCGKEMR